MRVKICGITNLEDALNSINSAADALGFNFYKKSPRYIEPKIAKEIISKLPPFVQSVGLFVECEAKEVNEISKYCKIDLAQIHFETNSEFYNQLDLKYIKVVRAKSKEDILKYKDEYRIVDAFVKGYGGEGKKIDSSWFEGVNCSKIILAGGLNEKNLPQIRQFGFYGVDVSSSVESTKGKKDKILVDNFIKVALNGKI